MEGFRVQRLRVQGLGNYGLWCLAGYVEAGRMRAWSAASTA